jgi:hypothetical protein
MTTPLADRIGKDLTRLGDIADAVAALEAENVRLAAERTAAEVALDSQRGVVAALRVALGHADALVRKNETLSYNLNSANDAVTAWVMEARDFLRELSKETT